MKHSKILPLGLSAGLALLFTLPAQAQDRPAPASPAEEPSAQGDVAVTIYNNDLALVQDVRTLNIAAGRSRIEFPDVSSRIRPETLSFASPGAAIVEQNFDFDLLSPSSLMEKAIGQTITLIRTNPATGAETRERATVLSTSGGVVVRIGDHIEVLRDDGLPVRAIFDRVPPNLRARPTLSVTVQSDRAGTRPASIRYLTPGLGWSADYVALYDEVKGSIDMQGWVTLTNQTGTSFPGATAILVAGSPATTGGGNSYNDYNRGRQQTGIVQAGTEKTNRDQLGDYYLYPIAGRTTIANAQTKQVSFLDVAGVAARKVYGRTIPWQRSDQAPVNVSSQIAFSTSRAGGLGDALPAGVVRFYQRDKKGTPQYIGESRIDHTPTGSQMLLTTGDAFDIFVQATVQKREPITRAEWEATSRYRVLKDGFVLSQVDVETLRRNEYYRTTMVYKLTNAKPQPVTVSLVQGGMDHGWWSWNYRVVSETVIGEQVNADKRKWEVPVPANGETELKVIFETPY